MRTTLALDDDLLERARELTGQRETTALVREALRALIEREAARRLARLGGIDPEFALPQRRRPLGDSARDEPGRDEPAS